MLPFRLFVQDGQQDASIHFTVSKEALMNGLTAGDFASIAVVEIIGEPFQRAMEAYVRQLRAESIRAITVIVLVEKPPTN